MALAAAAEAAPTIQIGQPAAGAVVLDAATVTVRVDSTILLSSVVARVGTASTTLLPAMPADGTFSGSIDLALVPPGAASLMITATDLDGQSSTASIAVTHSQQPTLTVTTPDDTVARPCLHLSVTCTSVEGQPCTSIQLVTRASIPAVVTSIAGEGAGPLVLDRMVSLAAMDGTRASFDVVASNSVGVATSRELNVIVDSSPTLIQVEEVDGRILDFDDDRVLFVGAAGVALKDRATKAVTTLGAGSPQTGVLLAKGDALWEGGEWRDGAFLGNDAKHLRVAGTWATWASGANVRRRNLAEQTSALVGSGYDPSVDDAGTVVFITSLYSSTDQGRFLHRVTVGGTDEVVTRDNLFPQYGIGAPRVGGTTVSWEEWSNRGPTTLHFRTSAGIDPVPGPITIEPANLLRGDTVDSRYEVRNGWLGFVRETAGSRGAWTLSPEGGLALASPLSNVSAVSALEPDGKIVYDVVADGKRSRYFGGATTNGPMAPLRIGGAFGRPVHRGATWYQVTPRVLYRVDTTATTPVGTCSDDLTPTAQTDGGSVPAAPAAPAANAAGPSSSSSDGGCAASGAPSLPWPLAVGGVLFALVRRRRARAKRPAR